MVNAHIDGLIIVDENGRPIVQTSFRNNFSVSYPLLHVDAYNHAIETAQNSSSFPKRIDPILFVNAPASPDRPTSVCCHVERGGLKVLCPVSADVEPSFVFAFLDTFLDTLQDYLGGVSSKLIKDHFDVVYQLLEEMLDNGIPLTTEPNTLRDIVLRPSLLNKLASVAESAGLSASTPAPFSSPMPWRKAGLRYNNNEIYFDITESLDAVVSSSGKIVTSEVYGVIKCNTRLSGTPDLLMRFANPSIITDTSFHPCVRFGRFTSNKELSFVPPDGSFTLMEYRVEKPTGTQGTNSLVPLIVKPISQVSEEGGSIEISATSKLATNKPLENVSIKLFLGNGANTVNLSTVTSTGLGHGGVNVPPKNGKEDSWSFDPKTRCLRWHIPLLDTSTRTIKGTFTSSEKYPRTSRSVNVSFELPADSLSGIRVEHMKVLKEAYKAYKGVRVGARGEIEWRL